MSLAAVARSSNRVSLPEFQKRTSHISSISSLDALIREIGITKTEYASLHDAYEASLDKYNRAVEKYKRDKARSPDDTNLKPPEKKLAQEPPTNLAQVCLVLFSHKTAQLFHDLRTERNETSYYSKFQKVAEMLEELDKKVRRLANPKKTKEISQVFSSCLLPSLVDDFATFATTRARLIHVLSPSELEKLRKFHGTLSEQVRHHITCSESVGTVPPELERIRTQLESGVSIPASSKGGFISSAVALVSQVASLFFVTAPAIQKLVFDPRITVEARSPLHFKLLCGLEKLSQTQHGRKFLKTMQSHHADRPFRINEAIGDSSTSFGDEAVMHIRRQNRPVTIVNRDGEEEWGESPFYIIIAHEMIHRLHSHENPGQYKIDLKDSKGLPILNFTSWEEYHTITGYYRKSKGDTYRHEFSENSLREAFGLPERTSHKGSSFSLHGPIDEVLEDDTTRFHEAGNLGLVGTLRKLLKQVPSVHLINARNAKGYTSLHLYIDSRKRVAVELLLDYKADPRIRTNQDENSLHFAVVKGDKPVIELVLDSEYLEDPAEKSRFINTQNTDKQTALYLALQQGCEDIASLLLMQGANAHLATIKGENPLHLAASKGTEEICEEILQRESTHDKRRELVNAQNKDKDTPLHLSVNEKRVPIVELFLIHGADATIKNSNGQNSLHCAADVDSFPCLELLLTHGDFQDVDINGADKLGYTALHYTVLRGNVEATALLLQYGARRDIRKGSDTPLDLAKKIKDDLVIRKELCDLLQDPPIPWGANKPLLLSQAASRGDTRLCMALCTAVVPVSKLADDSPLHLAILEGHQGTAAFLIRRVNVNTTNKKGETPLHCSVQMGDIHTTRRLLKKGAKTDCQDNEGNTPMHYVASDGRLDMVRLLEGFNASSEIQNRLGQMPIHVAVVNDHWDCIDFLAGLGNMNLRDVHGHAPLHIAVLKQSLQAVRLLFTPRTDLQVKDNEKQTPLDLAKQIKDRTKRNAICAAIEQAIKDS